MTQLYHSSSHLALELQTCISTFWTPSWMQRRDIKLTDPQKRTPPCHPNPVLSSSGEEETSGQGTRPAGSKGFGRGTLRQLAVENSTGGLAGNRGATPTGPWAEKPVYRK